MKKDISVLPNEALACSIVTSMIHEKAIYAIRMKTGDQYFVYAVKTENSEYVIRITDSSHRRNFQNAIYWQEKLLPLGIPLARFINSDLDGKYSPFLSLLMLRLPGNDLCNIYSQLTNNDKRNLALEMIKIQAATNLLPVASSYGIAGSYNENTPYKTWYDFLSDKLLQFMEIIKKNGVFDFNEIMPVISVFKNLQSEFHSVKAKPFLWDASERNVIVHNAKISGIVDVDDVCFGDPLFVIALTSIALEHEGYDTLYTDSWAEGLQLSNDAQLRLVFYKLFYAIQFMRKHAMTTTNNQKIAFNVERLKKMFANTLQEVKKFGL